MDVGEERGVRIVVRVIRPEGRCARVECSLQGSQKGRGKEAWGLRAGAAGLGCSSRAHEHGIQLTLCLKWVRHGGGMGQHVRCYAASWGWKDQWGRQTACTQAPGAQLCSHC